jgi:hypothetical protein
MIQGVDIRGGDEITVEVRGDSGGAGRLDYVLRLEKEYGTDGLWVAGYCNDVFAYIPSLRVLQEGGYEGGGAIVGARLPGPFAPSIEETIVRKVHELVERVRNKQ